MKQLYLILISFIASFTIHAQCPNINFVITLNSQAAVNNFAAQYSTTCPDLSNYSMDIGQINNNPTNIVDLTPLNFITAIGSLWIENNPQLTTLEGLENIVILNNLKINSNSQLSSLEFAGSELSNDFFLEIINNPLISDFSTLPNFTELDGLRVVDMNGISDFTGLDNLNRVGRLYIRGNQNLLSTNGLQVDLGSISGNSFILEVNDNPQLQSFSNSLLSVQNNGSRIIITNNPDLQNLVGLEQCQIAGWLDIINNDSLLNLSGLDGISQIGIFCRLIDNDSLFSLQGLQGVVFQQIGFVIDERIVISDNDALTTIEGFTSGSFRMEGLRVENNNQLQNLNGLEGINSIRIRNLKITGNQVLENLNGLSNINDVSIGGPEFRIENNPLLTDISGLTNFNLTSLSSNKLVSIQGNTSLSVCDEQSICDLISNNGPAQLIIDQNAPGCQNIIEVSVACGLDINIVSGAALFDFNADGCDPLDVVAPGLLVETTDGTNTFATFTNNLGEYQNFVQAEGTVSTSINPASLPPFFAATPASQDSNFTGFGNEDIIDFCITATQTINDLKISLIPLFDPNPGFDTQYQIVYENMGTTQLSGQVDLTIDTGRQTFVSSTPTETSNTGDVISWDYVDLNPFETRTINFTLNNFPPPTNQIGHEVGLSVEILPVDQDATPQDNAVSIKQNYVGSYDPNDKRVVQGEEIPEAMVGEYLDYIIRFQNLGNADAVDVVIEDILDPNLQWGTLRPLSSSHDYRVEILNGNEVSFIFENINLPPEVTDPQGSQGYIAFKIRTDNTLVVGDTVENTAAIFFDFNPPIITNTTTTTVVDLQPPTAICQSITVALDQNGTVTIDPADIDNGSNDNNGIGNLELDITTFDCSNIGENTVTLTVTDSFGNQSSCTAIVTVIDDLPPVLVCQSLTVTLDENGTADIDPTELVDLANTSDNCGIATFAASINQVGCNDIGNTLEVTVFAEDVNGNSTACVTTIEVTDTLPPVFDTAFLPVDETRFTDETGVYTLEDFTQQLIVTDNCTLDVITTQNPSPGTELSPGVYDIELTAVDEYTNTTNYTFELTVELLLGNQEFTTDDIIIYPNPVSEVLYIEINRNIVLEEVTLFSILGEELIKTKSQELDMSSQAEGMYFLEVRTDQGTITKKILKE